MLPRLDVTSKVSNYGNLKFTNFEWDKRPIKRQFHTNEYLMFALELVKERNELLKVQNNCVHFLISPIDLDGE